LFLDRDGVINKRLVDDYVKSWEEFEFLPGVLHALKIFNSFFKRIIIVSNQQGVGKELMSEQSLTEIHQKMTDSIVRSGGHVDKIYYCTELASNKPFCRKPNPGMAHQAKKDFPEIEFSRSIMAGDSLTDMQFGKNLGMKCIFISNENIDSDHLYDLIFPDLVTFANYLELSIKSKG
jgi:histidinol-phosphate phosphatase family protein